MIVFVETNFLLELAFKRDKYVQCQELVSMAENQKIKLALPAYSIVEPYETIVRRRKSRVQVHDSITRELKEITRSKPFVNEANQLAELTGLLIQVGETEQNELEIAIRQLLRMALIIDLNAEILDSSLAVQGEFSLEPQDSVVFASVLFALKQLGENACFITKNSKDFSTPEIFEVFGQHNSKILFDFEAGLNYVKHELAKEGS